MTTDQEVEDFLEHMGVKGMKWGVRRQRRNNAIARVGQGSGGKLDKARALSRTSLYDIARGGGLKGGAKRKSDRFTAREERMANGKTKVTDLLVTYGSFRYTDLIPVSTK